MSRSPNSTGLTLVLDDEVRDLLVRLLLLAREVGPSDDLFSMMPEKPWGDLETFRAQVSEPLRGEVDPLPKGQGRRLVEFTSDEVDFLVRILDAVSESYAGGAHFLALRPAEEEHLVRILTRLDPTLPGTPDFARRRDHWSNIPRVHADFNDLDDGGRVLRLGTGLGTRDIEAAGITLQDGLHVLLYDIDEDEHGTRDDLLLEGVVRWNNRAEEWAVVVDPQLLRRESGQLVAWGMPASPPPPRIFADFQNADTKGRLRLNVNGAVRDLDALGALIKPGLRVVFSDGEVDAEGKIEESEFEDGVPWVGVIDWSDIKDTSPGGLAPRPPSREEVRTWLRGLVEGTVDRSDANDWAMQWIGSDDARVEDRVVRRGLDLLSGADAPTLDRAWLYGQADFANWLAEFEQACREKPS